MITLRQRIFIIISVVVGLILAGLLLYYFVFKTGSKPQAFIQNLFQNTTSTGEVTVPSEQVATTSAPQTFEKYSPEVYVKQVSRIFVERFGSYSNQNDNQHIADVLDLVTPTMEKWLKTQMLTFSNDYIGQTTKVMSTRVDSIDSKKAVVLLETQQIQESKEGIKNIQRSGRVELVAVGDDWKVDGFFWDK
jgi:hypothetical protein